MCTCRIVGHEHHRCEDHGGPPVPGESNAVKRLKKQVSDLETDFKWANIYKEEFKADAIKCSAQAEKVPLLEARVAELEADPIKAWLDSVVPGVTVITKVWQVTALPLGSTTKNMNGAVSTKEAFEYWREGSLAGRWPHSQIVGETVLSVGPP